MSIPGPESGKPFERLLALDEKHEILVDLDYEITELTRDGTFLELGEKVLLVLLVPQGCWIRPGERPWTWTRRISAA